MDAVEPKVTILMAVHNGGCFLSLAVGSILQQTFSDFVFLIIDDASTDDTVEVIRSYNDERIRLLCLDENVGQTEALNIGLKAATTQWIARMDADDFSAPTRLEEQLTVLEQNPDLHCLGAYAWTFREDHKKQESTLTTPICHQQIKKALLAGSPLIHGTIVARRDSLLDVGGYNGYYRYSADIELYDRFLDKYRVGAIPVSLLGIRRHPRQGSRTIVALNENIEIFVNRLRNNNYSHEEALIVKNSLSKFYINRGLKFLSKFNLAGSLRDWILAVETCPLRFIPNTTRILLVSIVPIPCRIGVKYAVKCFWNTAGLYADRDKKAS